MNILDLRNDLIDSYKKLQNGSMTVREAKERANLAGKIMSSAKLQLEYNVHANKQAQINFLNVDENV